MNKFANVALGTHVKFGTIPATGLGFADGIYSGIVLPSFVPNVEIPRLLSAIANLKTELTSLDGVDNWEDADINTFTYVAILTNGIASYYPYEFIEGSIRIIKEKTAIIEIKNFNPDNKNRVLNYLNTLDIATTDITVTVYD